MDTGDVILTVPSRYSLHEMSCADPFVWSSYIAQKADLQNGIH